MISEVLYQRLIKLFDQDLEVMHTISKKCYFYIEGCEESQFLRLLKSGANADESDDEYDSPLLKVSFDLYLWNQALIL